MPPKNDRLRIDEYMTYGGCPHCEEVRAKAFRRVKGIRTPVLDLPPGEALVINPDYNRAGILTHFHIEMVRVADIRGMKGFREGVA